MFTREVGLDRVVADGFTIVRAIQSRSWPATSANLEYAAVWGTRGLVAAQVTRIADGMPVKRISTLLEPIGRIEGHPIRLAENQAITFEGCKPYGAGFVLEPEESAAWIEADPRNAEVLFPYLNGEDLNSRPDASPSRWVIDFNDRSEAVSSEFQVPYARVRELVRPERQKVNREALRVRWWQYGDKRPAMRKAIAGLDNVLVMAQTRNTLQPMLVQTGQVFSQKIIVFASNSPSLQAVLSSSVHYLWARKYSSSLRKDLSYTPSDSFLTLPRPESTERLNGIGKTLNSERREIMLRRDLGLTKLYNLVNDPGIADSADADVARMREIHVELDQAVIDAYGWSEPLEHGFHTYRQMRRWTVRPVARVVILDLLLEENHRRAATQGEAPPPVDTDDESADE